MKKLLNIGLPIIVIVLLVIALFAGHKINKKNSASKKKEIFNLTQQLQSKNNQISIVQKFFLQSDKNINDVVSPNHINFFEIFKDRNLGDFENYTISKYKTNDILFNANIKALASAYIDFYNEDNDIILATYDGIFASGKLNDIKKFKKIKSNITSLVKFEDFYINDQYGIKDILVDSEMIYVSLIGEKEKNCHNLKIIKAKINKEFLDFESFYETLECVNKKNKHGFLAHQGGGGRMVKKNDNSILFTTGEFRNRPLAQNINSSFGKILDIDIFSKEAKIISLGHRNPQGLYYSNKHDFIISTEHGPKGGDEINLNKDPLKLIKNFGWPISSYGEHYYKNYSREILDQAPLNDSHEKYGFTEPIKYFVPSIGISEIVPLDKNDTEFFIGAMGSEIIEKDLGLHYIKFDENRNKITDHNYVLLNERVRDIVVSQDRKTIILFLETSGSMAIIKKIR
jgi:hypothetical protein